MLWDYSCHALFINGTSLNIATIYVCILIKYICIFDHYITYSLITLVAYTNESLVRTVQSRRCLIILHIIFDHEFIFLLFVVAYDKCFLDKLSCSWCDLNIRNIIRFITVLSSLVSIYALRLIKCLGEIMTESFMKLLYIHGNTIMHWLQLV